MIAAIEAEFTKSVKMKNEIDGHGMVYNIKQHLQH